MIIAEIRGRGRKSVGVLCDELLILKRLSIDIDSILTTSTGECQLGPRQLRLIAMHAITKYNYRETQTLPKFPCR